MAHLHGLSHRACVKVEAECLGTSLGELLNQSSSIIHHARRSTTRVQPNLVRPGKRLQGMGIESGGRYDATLFMRRR
jgi:hypothetical protein